MSGIFSLQTGHPKCDAAYERIKARIDQYGDFETFERAIMADLKHPPETLNKWLLRALYAMEKSKGGWGVKFEQLLAGVEDEKREELKVWLNTNLEKVR